MLSTAAAALALFVGALMAMSSKKKKKLPGVLKEEGEFDSTVDLSDSGTLEERLRDFTRICESGLYFLDRGRVRLIEDVRTCLGKGESSTLNRWAYVLVSASTPFDFASQFRVPPNFSEARYVVCKGEEEGTIRIFWAGFLSADPLRPASSKRDASYYFLCYISEPLREEKETVRFAYRCTQNRKNFTLSKCIDEYFKVKKFWSGVRGRPGRGFLGKSRESSGKRC